MGSPRWYDDSNQDLLDNRTGGVFIYTLEEDTVATIRNATKRIVKASTTSDDTFAVFELGTGVSIDESFNIYSLYNKDGSILKYTFNGGAQRDWTEDELLSLNESGLIGGDLSIDTTDLVFGNPLASNSLRVIYTSDSNDVGNFSLSNDIYLHLTLPI